MADKDDKTVEEPKKESGSLFGDLMNAAPSLKDVADKTAEVGKSVFGSGGLLFGNQETSDTEDTKQEDTKEETKEDKEAEGDEVE